jgi:hypothetical protein
MKTFALLSSAFSFSHRLAFAIVGWSAVFSTCYGQSSESADAKSVMRIGIIGLDTSHAPAFVKLWNDGKADGLLAKQQIVCAFPGGSPDIESSISRVPQYTKEISELGVQIVSSVDELVSQVDAVVITTLDGRKHLEQVLPVMRAGKPLFIDKPLAGTLADAIVIQKCGEIYHSRWFTSSSLRFSPGIYKYRTDDVLRKQVKGAIAWSPCSLESTHPDLFWYGVHGVESLYTAMGAGCEKVSRVTSQGTDVAIGLWKDGRVGEFRGLRDGAKDYGLVVFGESKIELGGKYEGYAPLVQEIASFFEGAPAPVSPAESVELFAFMEAADESKRRDGAQVKLSEVVEKAMATANDWIAKNPQQPNVPK